VKSAPHEFPSYTKAERRIDAAIHAAGIAIAPVASLWLLFHVSGFAVMASLIVYCIGLIAMLSMSGLYNLLPNIRAREFVRRADQSVIFVMIAGTYTPFVVNRLPPEIGLSLGAFVWIAAAGGIALTLAYPHRYHRLKLAFYLLLGWAGLIVIFPLAATLDAQAFTLLIAGGLVYSLGAAFHAMGGRFHNAIWHGLVLLAAALQYFAMLHEFAA
jgi:hemolysin III